MERKAPVRAVNHERRRKLHDRNFGERAAAVRRMPCIIATGCAGQIVAAHVRARGMGGCNGDRKDLVPLCWLHHEQQHRIGNRAFDELHRCSLSWSAATIAAQFDVDGYP